MYLDGNGRVIKSVIARYEAEACGSKQRKAFLQNVIARSVRRSNDEVVIFTILFHFSSRFGLIQIETAPHPLWITDMSILRRALGVNEVYTITCTLSKDNKF